MLSSAPTQVFMPWSSCIDKQFEFLAQKVVDTLQEEVEASRISAPQPAVGHLQSKLEELQRQAVAAAAANRQQVDSLPSVAPCCAPQMLLVWPRLHPAALLLIS